MTSRTGDRRSDLARPEDGVHRENDALTGADEAAYELPQEADEALSAAFRIANDAFRLSLPRRLLPDRDAIEERLKAQIRQRKMVPFYEEIYQRVGWTRDDDFVKAMQTALEQERTENDAKLADAKENYGEAEILDAMMRIADMYARVGDKDRTIEWLDRITTEIKHLSTGQQVDIAMKKAILGFFVMDTRLIREQIERAKELNERGGDWDRRNRLKVYEGTYHVLIRDFSKASELMLDAIATFTAYEVYDYTTFIFYTVLVAMHTLSRVQLRARVVRSPDVLSVIHEVPHLSAFLNSLYECRYADFMRALTEVDGLLRRDRFLSEHASYFVREMRVRAYSQFLDAYKSVTMDGMARAFGVSTDFLDGELSRFIAAKRVNARIDKMRGVIESTRPDAKNAQYQSILKHGDMLLNRVQRLSRVVNA